VFSTKNIIRIMLGLGYRCSCRTQFQQLDILPIPCLTLCRSIKSPLHGQEGCVFFSGHLNLRACQYVWVRLAQQATFKSSTFQYVRAGKGLNILSWMNFVVNNPVSFKLTSLCILWTPDRRITCKDLFFPSFQRGWHIQR
jgi:hypothetical protein